MVEAMLRGWRAQQAARGLRADTAGYRERLVRRFQAFTNEFPWQWQPAHVPLYSPSAVITTRVSSRPRLDASLNRSLDTQPATARCSNSPP